MTTTQVAIAVLALVALVATVRIVLARPRGWLVLLVLQALWLACTGWLLFAPKPDADTVPVVVLTAGATTEQREAIRQRAARDERVYAVDRAVEPASDIRNAPDLATILRGERVASLQVVGGGLALRDREAFAALPAMPPLQFDPSPVVDGIVAVEAPRTSAIGRRITLRGRAVGLTDARVEWLDAAGGTLDTTSIADDGTFVLAATMKSAGLFRGTVQVLDASGKSRETWPVAIEVTPPPPSLRALVIGGGANAELKYLRRFLVDAGFALDGRVSVSRGIAVADGTPRIDVATLDASDVAIIDERGWATLRESDRSLLVEAVARGLGLILRATGVPADATIEAWRALGFDVEADDAPRAVGLLRARGLRDAPGVRATHDRAPIRVAVEDAMPLLVADDGTPLALARNRGRGRVALAWITDSYRAVLDGDPAQYAALWSPIVEGVLRPKAGASPIDVPAYGFVGERVSICRVADEATVRVDANADRLAGPALNREPATLLVDGTCAGFWPRVPGLHHVTDRDRSAVFHVFAPDEALAFRDDAKRRATAALVGGTAPQAAVATRTLPREWLALLWLVLGAACWFVERRARERR